MTKCSESLVKIAKNISHRRILLYLNSRQYVQFLWNRSHENTELLVAGKCYFYAICLDLETLLKQLTPILFTMRASAQLKPTDEQSVTWDKKLLSKIFTYTCTFCWRLLEVHQQRLACK